MEEETNERGHNLYQGIEEEMENMQRELEQGIEKDSEENGKDNEEAGGKEKENEEQEEEEEEPRPFKNEFKLISREISPKSHKSESKSMDFDHIKGNVIKSVLISAGKSSISSKKNESNVLE